MFNAPDDVKADILESVQGCITGFMPEAIKTFREMIRDLGRDEAILRAFSSSAGQFSPQDLVFVTTSALLIIAESDLLKTENI